jgi:membrane protein
MFRAFHIPISWRALLVRTFHETVDDDVTGLAAQLAYYFFLALFPALLFLVALASFFPLKDLMPQILGALARFAPDEVLSIVRRQLVAISKGQNTGLLTIGFLGTLWSTSSAISGIIDTLNHTYGITDSRPWWKVRLIAIALTIGVGLFVLVSFALVIVGPSLAGPAADWLGLGPAFATTWRIVQWPIVFALVATAVGLIFYFGPDAEQQWEWITPGSLIATILWILASLGFRYYVVHFGGYNRTYGAIGGVIVALLWMYISGLAILIGAEVNAEIEHASPYGKEPGEKRPGEKRKLGRLAQAAYERMRKGSGRQAAAPAAPPVVPLPVPMPAPASAARAAAAEAARPDGGRLRRRASDRVRLSDWVLGGVAIVAELAVAARRIQKSVKG